MGSLLDSRPREEPGRGLRAASRSYTVDAQPERFVGSWEAIDLVLGGTARRLFRPARVLVFVLVGEDRRHVEADPDAVSLAV